jgi:hypothetical protein
MGQDFDWVTISTNGKKLIALEANLEEHDAPIGGSVVCNDTQGNVGVAIHAASAQFGGSILLVRDGAIQLVNSKGVFRAVIHTGDPLQNQDSGQIILKAGAGDHDTVSLGGDQSGDLYLRNFTGQFTVAIRAVENDLAGIWVGGKKQKGLLILRNGSDKDTVSIGGGETGDIYLRNKSGEFTVAIRAVENDLAGIWVGGKKQKGLLILRNGSDKDTVSIGGGETGDIYLRNKSGEFTVAIRAVEGDTAGIWIGGKGQDGHIVIRNASDAKTIHLDGQAGDIRLANADCAEEFEVTPGFEVQPGNVMVIDEAGLLKPSTAPYDRSVAGVASGGGSMRPGIVLGHLPNGGRRLPVALSGRVCCDVDADFAPIAVADLLTTSSTLGHAMKATDSKRAFGAVIGKALAPLRSGRGQIPILVALQ